MRGLFLTYTEKVIALEETNAELTEELQEQAEQIAEDAPNVHSYHCFIDDTGTRLGLQQSWRLSWLMPHIFVRYWLGN